MSSSSTMITIKMTCTSTGVMRKFFIPRSTRSIDPIRDLTVQRFSLDLPQEKERLEFSYEDLDGDQVTLSTREECEELFSTLPSSTISLRFSFTLSPSPTSSDAPLSSSYAHQSHQSGSAELTPPVQPTPQQEIANPSYFPVVAPSLINGEEEEKEEERVESLSPSVSVAASVSAEEGEGEGEKMMEGSWSQIQFEEIGSSNDGSGSEDEDQDEEEDPTLSLSPPLLASSISLAGDLPPLSTTSELIASLEAQFKAAEAQVSSAESQCNNFKSILDQKFDHLESIVFKNPTSPPFAQGTDMVNSTELPPLVQDSSSESGDDDNPLVEASSSSEDTDDELEVPRVEKGKAVELSLPLPISSELEVEDPINFPLPPSIPPLNCTLPLPLPTPTVEDPPESPLPTRPPSPTPTTPSLSAFLSSLPTRADRLTSQFTSLLSRPPVTSTLFPSLSSFPPCTSPSELPTLITSLTSELGVVASEVLNNVKKEVEEVTKSVRKEAEEIRTEWEEIRKGMEKEREEVRKGLEKELEGLKKEWEEAVRVAKERAGSGALNGESATGEGEKDKEVKEKKEKTEEEKEKRRAKKLAKEARKVVREQRKKEKGEKKGKKEKKDKEVKVKEEVNDLPSLIASSSCDEHSPLPRPTLSLSPPTLTPSLTATLRQQPSLNFTIPSRPRLSEATLKAALAQLESTDKDKEVKEVVKDEEGPLIIDSSEDEDSTPPTLVRKPSTLKRPTNNFTSSSTPLIIDSSDEEDTEPEQPLRRRSLVAKKEDDFFVRRTSSSSAGATTSTRTTIPGAFYSQAQHQHVGPPTSTSLGFGYPLGESTDSMAKLSRSKLSFPPPPTPPVLPVPSLNPFTPSTSTTASNPFTAAVPSLPGSFPRPTSPAPSLSTPYPPPIPSTSKIEEKWAEVTPGELKKAVRGLGFDVDGDLGVRIAVERTWEELRGRKVEEMVQGVLEKVLPA